MGEEDGRGLLGWCVGALVGWFAILGVGRRDGGYGCVIFRTGVGGGVIAWKSRA